jgi:hypothetical protein
MVKLYSHGGRLAVLSSRSNRGFGNQGSAYGLRSAASGPRASAGAGCANEANSRREYPTIPLIYHSTIPVPPVPSGAGPRGHGTRGLCETYPVLRFLIGDCGLGTDLGRDATPAACRLWPAQAGRTNKPNSQSRLCETNPIGPGLGRARAAMGERCETNTNPGTQDIPPSHYSIIPVLQSPSVSGGTRLLGRGTRGNRAKQDAHDKSRRVGFRPAFPGRYRRSVRLNQTFVGRVKQSQSAGAGANDKCF